MTLRLGWELVTGSPVEIPLRHTAITGETQWAGKTTTAEAWVSRSGMRAVAFITKPGEKSFRLQTPIPPYFHEPKLDSETPMWRWVESIFGTLGESVGSDDQALIIQCSRSVLQTENYKVKSEKRVRVVESGKSVTTLSQVAENVALMLKYARGRDRKSLTRLDAYFQIVMPQIKRMRASAELALADGINVMDLEDMPVEMQMLIIRSTLETVYSERRKTAVIIPEAWKFLHRTRNSPVRFAAQLYIRQGLVRNNILMLDSQDLASIDTEVLKSIGVWILGKQSEINEVKRVVDYIPASPKIPREEIMQLGKGQFYIVAEGKVKKCYVQPAGMEDLHAQAIARGDESADSWKQIEKKLDSGKVAYSAEGLASVWGRPDAPQTQEESDNGENPGAGGTVREDRDRGGQWGTGESPAVSSGGEANPGGEGGDDVWKEKFEELKRQFHEHMLDCHPLPETPARADLQDPQVAATPRSNGIPKVTNESGEIIVYEVLKKHLLSDVGMLAALDAARPQLHITVHRPVINFDGGSIKGRLALLVEDGFFKQPKKQADTLREFKRRGWLDQKAGNVVIIRPMAEITEMGFLTIEAEGYRAVPGTKISKAES